MEYDNVSFSVSAPGKVILMGEHSVVYHKKGVATSISKRTYLHFKEHKHAHGQITLNLKNIVGVSEWDFKTVYDLITTHKPLLVDNLKAFNLMTPELLNHDDFVEMLQDFVLKKILEMSPRHKSLIGIFYVIVGMLWCTDVNITPFDIEVTTDLDIGAGTGSSASFAVCCAAAMYHYIRLKGSQKHGVGEYNISYEMFNPYNINLSQHYCSFSLEDKEVINKWAYCIERVIHGTPSGLDNTICTYGNTVLLNVLVGHEVKRFQILYDVPSLRILLINSHVERSTSNMVKKVSELHQLCPEAINSILQSMDTVTLQFINLLYELKKKEKNDISCIYTKIEVLTDIQHCLLSALGVSHKCLEQIRQICSEGDLHAKLTGAGGGGYSLVIVPPSVSDDLLAQTKAKLCSAGFTVDDVIGNSEGVALDFKNV